MDNTESIVSRLSTRFGNVKPIVIKQGYSNMLSNRQNFYRTKVICNGPMTYSVHNDIILNETLIDHFFKIFGSNLIYTEKNKDVLIDKIHNFCQKNGIHIDITQDDTQPTHGRLEGNVICISFTSNTKEKEIIYITLHELSHYITNYSSSNKLKQFITEPLKYDINIHNLYHMKQELNYFLSPAEISNWAFTLSLSMFEEKYKSASMFYKLVKDAVYEVKFENINNIFSTKFYKNLSEDLRPLYHLVVYVRQLKELKLEHRQRLKYQNKLMSLIKILDKYVKRLNKLFK